MYNQHLSADLAAQIAFEINMPVTHLCRAGFNAKDAALAFAGKPETLDGRRVVVVSFISRALSDCADWTPIPIRTTSAASGDLVRELPVTGKVASMSQRPPERSEYLDYFMQFHVTDLRDAQGRKVGSGEGVVHVLAVKNKRALPVAKTKVGDAFKMALTSWSLVEKAYGKIQRGTLDDLDVLLDSPYYYGHLEGQKETPRADKF
jgi:hypothetical protein